MKGEGELPACSTYANIPRTTAALIARVALLIVTIPKGDFNILMLARVVDGGNETLEPSFSRYITQSFISTFQDGTRPQ